MRDLMRIAMIQPAEAQAHEVPKGLEGVVVAETTVGDVRGLEGFYHYRQYSAVDLAQHAPARRRLAPDVRRRSSRRRSPSATRSRPRSAPRRAIPDCGRATCCPRSPRAGDDVRAARRAAHRGLAVRRRARASGRRSTSTHATLRDNALSTCAVVPDADHRAVAPAPRPRAGRARTRPRLRRELPLHDARRGARRPSTRPAVEKYLISTIDHGFNASTFTARVITSTGADLGAAVVGAIGALSGPLHGGAPSRALADARRDRHAPTAPSRGCATRSSAATG